MKILYLIWNNLIPKYIQILIKKSLLIWKLWKLKIDKQSYEEITLNNILKNEIIIDKTVTWNYKINLRWNINIWKYSNVNWPNTYLMWCSEFKIKIWKYCSIAPNVTIISSNNHNYKKLTITPWPIWYNNNNIWWNIIIWNDVWIWANSIILSWLNIWDWAIIWAWSIVTKDIPDYAIAVWAPAKIIKYRFSKEIRKKIKKIKWWNWPLKKIKENYNLEFIKNAK